MTGDAPILEHDPDPGAMIEPSKLVKPVADMPQHGVICFFQSVIDHLKERGHLVEIAAVKSEMGRHPVYRFVHNDRPIALFSPGVCAPLAAGILEEVIAMGCRKFIACGGAGVLDSAIALGHLLVPASAVRDEGTSYHYLPPSREVEPTPAALVAIRATLDEKKIDYRLVKTWTTDALYRETRGKVTKRRAEGCACVEMEASALFAVARFRGVELAQILYAGDDLGGEYWDGRNWNEHWTVREQLIFLAAEACLAIS